MDVIYTPADDNYFFEDFGGVDYAAEVKVPLDSISFGDDVLFQPKRGMRIPLELYFHDNDGSGWEGNLARSPFNTDHAWKDPSEWEYTWIGDTTHTQTGVEDAGEKLVVTSYSLSQNYPNPFNPTTTIDYSLAKDGLVKVELYNTLGQKLETVVNEHKSAGRYSINFNGEHLSSGVYFYRIEVSDFAQTRKMLLMK